jgi:hypothetical protein
MGYTLGHAARAVSYALGVVGSGRCGLVHCPGCAALTLRHGPTQLSENTPTTMRSGGDTSITRLPAFRY